MYTQIYRDKKTYSQFDNGLFLLFLEETVTDFVSESHMPGEDETPAEPAPAEKGFSYSGNHESGGTLIAADAADYGAFVSGLIGLRYSSADETALQTNLLIALKDKSNAKAAQYKQEFDEYNTYRAKCKADAKSVLGMP
jgi:hypothetical protein